MVPSGNGNQYFLQARSHERCDNPRFSRGASLGWNPRARKFTEIFQRRKIGSYVPAVRPGTRAWIRARYANRRERGERTYRWRIWYSWREEGITSWEDSQYPRDLVNRCAGPRNFKPRTDIFDSLAISSARSELADSYTSWHTSYFTYVIFFTRSAREALSKTVISFSHRPCRAQFCVNCRLKE